MLFILFQWLHNAVLSDVPSYAGLLFTDGAGVCNAGPEDFLPNHLIQLGNYWNERQTA
jgi:hypothetical protein